MTKTTGTEGHRDRILKTALGLLVKHGRDALTTRSVAEAAGVQPPVLYRIFGDKEGLLEAVAAYGFAAYLARKRAHATVPDAVEALRSGWDLHVAFGLENPELYLLMYANPGVKRGGQAAAQSFRMLAHHMEQVAAEGRLQTSVATACELYHAAAVGVVMSLLARDPEQRELSLSPTLRDLALAFITTKAAAAPGQPAVVTAANQLLAHLQLHQASAAPFTGAERQLFVEWLGRLTKQTSPLAETPNRRVSKRRG